MDAERKRSRRGATVATAIITAASVTLGVVAFTHPGFTTTSLELSDGGVWVTNQSTSQLGHINQQAEEIDSALTLASSNFDVLQNAGTVLVRDDENLSLHNVNTGQATIGPGAVIPGGAQITLGGGTVSIVDPATGKVWALPASRAESFNMETLDPVAELGEGAVAVADSAGRVHAFSPRQGTQLELEAGDEGFVVAEERERAEIKGLTDLTITAVGEDPVVLEATSGTLVLPGGVVQVPERSALQIPGTEARNVVLATPTELLTVPLGGGDVDARAMSQAAGSAVAPVQTGGCIYGAWPGDGRVVRTCEVEAQNLDEELAVSTSPNLVFREHRGVVALNDMEGGVSWLLSDELIMVDNWADLIPPKSDEQSEEEDENSADELLDNRAPEESEENMPPVANDDVQFGGRTGRATLVPVTSNDTDPDGDILAVSLVGEQPRGVRVSPVRNNTQFQVEIPADYNGNSVTFEYEVNDGRGGSDRARVTMPVRSDDENSPPEPLRVQRFEVEQRASYEHHSLESWFDPDGDDFYLVGAESDSGDTVQFNPNGRIVYTATGEVGPTTMRITVSDGRDETTEEVKVDVRERGEGRPFANSDYVSATEGQRVTVRPLANDFLPGKGVGRVASAAGRGGVDVKLDRATNTVTVRGEKPGTYYVDYVLAAGAFSSQATIRVDVSPPDQDSRPVAVRDLALLPAGGEAIVDLTENDVDPAGGVLVVQSVMVGDAPLSAQLVNRNMLRIRSANPVSDPVVLRYEVSNGRQTATGEIVVIPVPAPEKSRPPVAVDDTATLREGDFTSVAVMKNDFSPDSVPFTLEPKIVSTSLVTPAEGEVFVAGDHVRVHVVVDGPASVDVVYEIVDEFGNKDTATLRVNVERRDAESNQPPIPKPVTARVLAGSTVRIPIPLNGIDPDGDGATLVGFESNPTKGRVVATGPDYFDFEAFDGEGGTTEFDYRVQDRWGASSVSTVTVGIASPGSINQSPFAELDTVSVRPGRAVAVAVLDNDSDPDGDLLFLHDVLVDDAPPEVQQLRMGEGTQTVNFNAPEEPGTYTVEYVVRDERGAQAVGAIQINVEELAPPIAPTAVDDVVDVSELAPGDPYVVNVKENDRDLDGDPAELAVSVLTGPGVVVGDQVQVEPGEEWFVVTYRVEDQDGGQGEAFILVPGIGKRPPQLRAGAELTIPSGHLLTIDLDSVVETFNGNAPRITKPETVSATHANGDALVKDDVTLLYTSELGYVGKAAITFEVTDGSGPDDPAGSKARISVPITVTPSSAVPPRFTGAEIQVQPGEAATEYDLRTATIDPDPDDVDNMRYEFVGGSGDGITAGVDGPMFRAAADAQVPPGTTVAYQVRLTDPHGNQVNGTVQVRVVPSTRPLPVAQDDRGEVHQGVPITVGVLENDFNPFANLGEPLVVTSVTVVNGTAQDAPTTDGSTVTVTPGADFSGVLTLQYTIQDATRSTGRQALGTVRINVLGRPDTPVRPNVDAIGDSQVTLSWVAPAANGAPITGYRVQWNGGSQECPSTSCTITGLKNDTIYNFQVIAINEVGESDPSAASIDARPDVRPDRPNPPTATRGDTQLQVQWTAPTNRGSAITHYVLTISPPAPGGRVQQEVQGTSFTWTGLENGTAYTFNVQAFNNADEPSDVSGESAAVIPAGPPSEVSNISSSANQMPGTGTNQITVQWGAANGNGVAVDRYYVQALQGGSPVGEPLVVAGSDTSVTFASLAVSTTPYTFQVTAENAVSKGKAAEGGSIRAVNPPDAPTIVHVADGDGASTVEITPGGLNGFAENEVRYEVQIDGGAWQQIGTGQQSISASNGEHNAVVRAVGTVDGTSSNSQNSNTVKLRPYGPPPAPTLNVTVNQNSVTFNWSVQGDNGRPIEGVEYRFGGQGNWQQGGVQGSVTQNGSPGQTISIQIRTRAEGGPSPETKNQGTIPRPQPRLTLRQGAVVVGNNGQKGVEFRVTYENLKPGTYTYTCYNDSDKDRTRGIDSFTNGTVVISGEPGQDNLNRDKGGRMCFNNYGGNSWFSLDSGPSVDEFGQIVSPKVPWPQQ